LDATVADLERLLKKNGLEPVYVIHGPEPFLRSEALRLIKEAATEDTDLSEPEPTRLDPAALLDDLRTTSLFAPKRLVIVDGADALIANSADLLCGYAERPGATTTLALAAESVDARKKPVKRLLKNVVNIPCPAMKPREIPTWCMHRARYHGKPMDSEAARLLVDLAGTGLGQLDGQIRALVTYCHERKRITSKHVAALVGGDHARTVWDLVRAISDRAPAKALRALDRLLREPKVTTPWILGALAREMRDLWRLKQLVSEGHPDTEIQKRMGKAPWLTRRMMQNVRRMELGRLKGLYRLLLRADVASKTGLAPDSWILQSLTLQLCR